SSGNVSAIAISCVSAISNSHKYSPRNPANLSLIVLVVRNDIPRRIGNPPYSVWLACAFHALHGPHPSENSSPRLASRDREGALVKKSHLPNSPTTPPGSP